LKVSSVGLPTVTLAQRSPARQVHAIATLIDSPQAREAFRTVKDATRGPGVEWVRAGGVVPERHAG
jgi:hypothetical protein